MRLHGFTKELATYPIMLISVWLLLCQDIAERKKPSLIYVKWKQIVLVPFNATRQTHTIFTVELFIASLEEMCINVLAYKHLAWKCVV